MSVSSGALSFATVVSETYLSSCLLGSEKASEAGEAGVPSPFETIDRE